MADLNWTGNDNSARNNAALVRANVIFATLRLHWKAL